MSSDADPVEQLGFTPPYDFERADDAARLERALAGLPRHQRVPLVPFHFDGQSYEQIASTLRISIGKLKTDMHRGRLALKRHLMAYGSR